MRGGWLGDVVLWGVVGLWGFEFGYVRVGGVGWVRGGGDSDNGVDEIGGRLKGEREGCSRWFW